MSPHVVHHGGAGALTARRALTLDAAFIAHPNRFKASPRSHLSCRMPPGSIHRKRTPLNPLHTRLLSKLVEPSCSKLIDTLR